MTPNDPMNITDLFFVVLGVAGCFGIGFALVLHVKLALHGKARG